MPNNNHTHPNYLGEHGRDRLQPVPPTSRWDEGVQRDQGAPESGILGAALAHADRGWPLVPLFGVIASDHGSLRCECSKGDDCRSAGKHPRWRGWPEKTTTNPEVIRAWYGRWPEMNFGIALGAEAGAVVLDFDPRHGSEQALARLQAAHGALPATQRHETPSGGFHLLYRWPVGRWVGNSIPALCPAREEVPAQTGTPQSVGRAAKQGVCSTPTLP